MLDASSLRDAGLSDDDAATVVKLLSLLGDRQHHNKLRAAYYEGEARVRQLGIAIPPQMQSVKTVVGWPSTIVDAIEERTDIDGFAVEGTADDLGLGEIWHDNSMPVSSGMAHVDALIHGVGFLTVTPGGDGEPAQLLTVEPATTMTGVWDARSRRLTSALSAVHDDHGQISSVTLFTLDGIHDLVRQEGGGWSRDSQDNWLADERRLPVYRLVNRPRSSKPWGQSEITSAVRSYVDTAVRTLLGMEIAREFYSSPQRWIMGAKEDAFVGADGEPRTAWETYLGRILALERDEDGQIPAVGQFNAASPEPYVAQVKLMAELVAAESALPLTYLGFHTHNPPGGDGIRAQETRHVKRAERRARTWGPEYALAMSDAVFLRDGTRPPRITTLWRDPATPTRAATADEVTKYVATGVLRPDSEVTRERVGFDEATRRRLADEDQSMRARETVMALRQAGDAARQDPRVAQLTTRRPEDGVAAADG